VVGWILYAMVSWMMTDLPVNTIQITAMETELWCQYVNGGCSAGKQTTKYMLKHYVVVPKTNEDIIESAIEVREFH